MPARPRELAARYGPWALVAGASEGLGAGFAHQLAARGLHLVLVARRGELLARLARELGERHGVEVREVAADLAQPETTARIETALADVEVGLLVYNAALSVSGPFLDVPLERHLAELEINCRRPLELCHRLGHAMRRRGRGGILLMASLAGAQGAPHIAHYAATKAWSRVLGEGLWWELRQSGVDVLACCAGATRTPGYLAARPEQTSGYVPEMEPEAVVREALAALGRSPSMIPGRANRLASFFLSRLLPRRSAIGLMGRAAQRVGVE